jgi:hypothetical protein
MIKETAAQIQSRLIAALQANPTLYDPGNLDPYKRGLTSPSQVALWRQFLNLISTEQALFEDLLQIFEQDVEALIRSAPVGSNAWIQKKVLEFQYDAVSPQVLQLDANYAISYPAIDSSKRIITQCAVPNDATGGFYVKVASNLAPLSSPQYNALVSYLEQINFGTTFTIINANPDLLMIGADIQYNAQYSTFIQDAKNAIRQWQTDFNTNNFNGKVLLSKIEDVIQAVPGCVDVVFRQVEATPDGLAIAVLVNNSQVLQQSYDTYAGYSIIDPNAGRTLDDTLTFIPV